MSELKNDKIQNILINVCLVCMSIAALAITYACIPK